jgi:hypothetical protein
VFDVDIRLLLFPKEWSLHRTQGSSVPTTAGTPASVALDGLRSDIRDMTTLLEAQVATTSAQLTGIEQLARIAERAESREARHSRAVIGLTLVVAVSAVIALPGLITFVQTTVVPFTQHLARILP